MERDTSDNIAQGCGNANISDSAQEREFQDTVDHQPSNAETATKVYLDEKIQPPLSIGDPIINCNLNQKVGDDNQTCSVVDTDLTSTFSCGDAVHKCSEESVTLSSVIVDMFKSSSDEEENADVDAHERKSQCDGLDADFADGKDLERCRIRESPSHEGTFKESSKSKKRTTEKSNSEANSEESNTSEQNSTEPVEAKKQKRSDAGESETDDEYMDARGDDQKEAGKPKKVKLRSLNLLKGASSDNDDDKSSSDSDKSTADNAEKRAKEREEEELWLKKDIKDLSPPQWRAVPALRYRQTLASSLYWPFEVCGARAMVQRFKLHSELEQHQGCVNALHFNQSGSLLASGSDDLKIILWDWMGYPQRPAISYDSGHKSNVFQAKFLPDCGDSTVVSTARDGQVRAGNISTTGSCRGTKKVAQHRGSAHKLSLDIDSRSTFLSCGEDGAVFGIDLRLDKTAEKLVTVKSERSKVALYSIHTNPSRPYEFAVSGRDPNARVFDRRMLNDNENTSPVKEYCPHHLQGATDTKANITCLVYNWDGSELLCSYNDEDIYLFDTSHSSGADYIKRYKGHRNNATVKGVNFYGPRSEFVVSGSDCGNIFFWEKDSSRIVSLVKGDNGGVVNVLEPHPNLPVIATSGLDHEVKIWTPSADPLDDGKLSQLHSLMLSNRREREEERRSMPDMIDGHMLWFLMRTLRSRTRRRHANPDDDTSSDDDDLGSSNSSDSSDGGPGGRMTQCTQS